ncbi:MULTISPECIES: glycosyltransferase [unclassified Microcoleus]|uniref:glycosyltransferase n=1 Tax=unclassified Microcoleus TaxID=2642155 RepID=UPI002FD38434
MRQNVVFLIRDLNYGGAQRQLVTLVKGLNKQSFDVIVLCFYRGGPLEKELKDNEIPLICLEKRERWDIFGFFWRLFQHLKHIQPDVLHGYLGESNVLTIFLKPLFPSTKMIWGIRGSNTDPDLYGWLGRVLSQLESLLSPFADSIIVNSHAGKTYYLTHGFPSDKMVVIPNGLDTKRFQPDSEARAKVRAEWKISENTILIGLVGRLNPMKDHPNFLKAAALICKQRQDVHFVCVGTGLENYAQELYELTSKLGINERVIWAGARPDMPAVHNALDIATSASAYGEGFANVIGEAMACGVPCVVTDVGDSKWIVGDAGVVVAPSNAQALFAGWLEILQMNREKLSIMARTRIKENFQTKVLYEKTENILISVIRQR